MEDQPLPWIMRVKRPVQAETAMVKQQGPPLESAVGDGGMSGLIALKHYAF